MSARRVAGLRQATAATRHLARPIWRALLWALCPSRRPALRAARARGDAPAETVTLRSPGGDARRFATPATQAALPAAYGPAVSIIVVNWNRAMLTQRCLRHVAAFTPADTEVIVVDNGSAGQDMRLLTGSGGRVLALGRNAGFGGANNAAAAIARGTLLCLLNNDVFVTEGWLPALCAALRPGVAAVGPRLLYPCGTVIQEAGGMLPADGFARLRARGMTAGDPDYAADATVDYLSAACVLLRRADFLGVGGFDPLFHPAYYEDADLCLRLRPAGVCRSIAGSVCFHAENASTAGRDLRALVAINRARFVRRWGAELARHG